MNFSTVHSGRTRDPTADVFKAANASLVTSNPNLTATSSITNNNISAGGFDRLVIVQLMCFPVITAAGLIGNILICFAVFRRRRLRITDVFILNLAATDLGTCVISIPFDFAVLLAKQWPFGNIQSSIHAELGTEEEYELIPSQRLHITLLMLTLRNEDQVTTAKNILKSVQPVLVSILPLSHKLRFKGLGHFHERILYASIEPDARLSKIVQVLKFKFGKAGISLEGNRNVFVPHVTILKGTSKDFASHEHVQKKLTNVATANHKLGEQSVQSLVLYSRFLPKDVGGTYHKISTVENSLKSLSSTLPKKLLQRVDHMFDSEKVCEDHRNELQELFQSGDAVKLDKAVTRLTELYSCSVNKMVVIMRGISGSGKTHLVENSVEARDYRDGYVYCSARQLFHKTGGSIPDAAELNIAEAYCRSCFMDAMATERSFVVVDGVHTKCWDYAVYKYLARAFGYACRVLEIRVTDPEDIKECLQNNTSGVQLEELLEAVQDWEDDPEATVIEPWFNKPDTLKHKATSLKQLLLAT